MGKVEIKVMGLSQRYYLPSDVRKKCIFFLVYEKDLSYKRATVIFLDL